ncbi:hypothetical protein D9M70_579570 [compost metagenome]
MIASDSQTSRSPWRSSGTFPVGEIARISGLPAAKSKGMTTSSKAMPAAVIAIQGRIDQDE